MIHVHGTYALFNNCMQVFTERKLSIDAESDDPSLDTKQIPASQIGAKQPATATSTKPIPDGDAPLKVA